MSRTPHFPKLTKAQRKARVRIFLKPICEPVDACLERAKATLKRFEHPKGIKHEAS